MAGAASSPGSASRFTQFFQRSHSISSHPQDDVGDPENAVSREIEVHSPSQARHRNEHTIGSLSSSVTVPTRSYFQRQFHPSSVSGDIQPTSWRGVREETAELATRALADTRNGPSHPTLKLSHSDLQVPTTFDPQPSSSRGIRRQHSSTSMNVPPIIPELSESVSQPQSSTDSRSSMLTAMIRSSPPKNLEPGKSDVEANEGAVRDESESDDDFTAVVVSPAILSQPHERSPLLQQRNPGNKSSYGLAETSYRIESGDISSDTRTGRLRSILLPLEKKASHAFRIIISPKSWDGEKIWKETVIRPIGYFPAILLGLLLNVLDALSYGMILFPLGQPLFAELGPDGISMFYVSCIVSQLVYSLGGSIFKSGVGSEMIEVVPFFHKMAFTIMAHIGEQNPKAVLATTVLSYSLSSILTGAVFFLLGQCKLGAIIGFFPRHILIGCIGGVGFFLVATGLEVSARLDGELEYNLRTLKHLFDADTIALWTIPLALAISLFIVKKWVKHSLVDAAWFVSIIFIFYIVVAAVPDLSVEDLRGTGWVFEAPAAGVPWYHFYTLYDFSLVDWTALAQTIPAMFALTFFGVLHVPINVPALGISTGEDNVNVDRELKAHGLSNALSGFAGSIQNYLVYTNTVLFMRSGADSRLAGVLLAFATCGILVAGPAIIGYIPVMVVGTLIFFLGIDLMREALVDTVGRVHKLEYLTILIIVLTMGIYDFVSGILAGIVLACVSFVFQTSQISAIRGTLPGSLASSMVRRHPMQHRFLQEVGRQIYVMKLAGYLFFGTIVGVENSIRAVLRDDAFQSRPLQFMVIDLSKVDGVDFSAAEAFTRINRILNGRDVQMVLSGFQSSSDVGRSLQNVGLLDAEDGIEFFEVLNSALEHCENELLKSFYQQRAMLSDKNSAGDGGVASADALFSGTVDVPTQPDANIFPTELIFNSPRRGQLQTAAAVTLREQERIMPRRDWQRASQPLQLIIQTFADFSDREVGFWERTVPYFSRCIFEKGHVLYRAGDHPDGFYLLESGILRAAYHLPGHGGFNEVIAPGATCGELPFFGDTRRTATVLAERPAVAWVLGPDSWSELQRSSPELAAEMLKIGLRITSERVQAMTKYMLLAGT